MEGRRRHLNLYSYFGEWGGLRIWLGRMDIRSQYLFFQNGKGEGLGNHSL